MPSFLGSRWEKSTSRGATFDNDGVHKLDVIGREYTVDGSEFLVSYAVFEETALCYQRHACFVGIYRAFHTVFSAIR